MEGLAIITDAKPRSVPAYAQMGLLSHLANLRIRKVVHQHLSPLHLSQMQYHVLYVLGNSDCWMRQRDLNSVLHVSRKGLRDALIELSDRHMVVRLVPTGMCRLCKRPACYRCATLHISDLGKAILLAADALVDAAYQELAHTMVKSEYQSCLSFLHELSGINLEARLGLDNRLITLTPRSDPEPKIRPAG